MNHSNLTHEAANEALSISMGIQMLASIPKESLTPAQQAVMGHVLTSSARLVELIEQMKHAHEMSDVETVA